VPRGPTLHRGPSPGSPRIHRAYKEVLQASVPELIYVEPLRITGELPAPTADPVNPTHLISQLRQHMARLSPVPAARHAYTATFLHRDLEKCTHVFLRKTQLTASWSHPTTAPTRSCHGERKRCNSRARQARHRVNRQGQAGLHAK
jgi:hypothetical protein